MPKKGRRISELFRRKNNATVKQPNVPHRLAVEDCTHRDNVCQGCIGYIVQTMDKTSTDHVDESRNALVLCDEKIAAMEPSCSRCVALGKPCIQVPELVKHQAEELYNTYHAFHKGTRDQSQRVELHSKVRDWIIAAYNHQISDGVQPGLNQVFPPREQAEKTESTVLDIVAIHGLSSTSLSAWVAWRQPGDANSGNVHWLKDPNMLPKQIPSARIFTYDWNANYDNDAADERLLGHGDDLLRLLRNERQDNRKNRPVLFIASCFGGLLLAKALYRASEADSEYRDILESVIGVAFLGTPFHGCHDAVLTAAQMRIAIAEENGAQTSGRLVRYLNRSGNDELDELVQTFCEMVAKREPKLPIICFYERQTTELNSLLKSLPTQIKENLPTLLKKSGIIADKNSACLLGYPQVGLPVRHNMLIKYSGPADRTFITVSAELKRLVDEGKARLEKKGHATSKQAPDMYEIRENEILEHLGFTQPFWSGRGMERDSWFSLDKSNQRNSNIPTATFFEWISSNKKMLWISGKPGCGKSTMMHWLDKEQSENQLLSKTVHDSRLIYASFFFVERSGELQKSRQGMIRSLLHQILSRDRNLIRIAFPNESTAKSQLSPSFLSLEDLRLPLDRVVQQCEIDQRRIIFLLDGVDEFRDLTHSRSYSQEDFDLSFDSSNEAARWGISNWIKASHEEISRLIWDLLEHSTVRLVVSSRELPIFVNSFRDAKRIRVHEHTGPAIRKYCQRRIESETGGDMNTSSFVDWIVLRASGVFLWVRLVVDMLVRGYSDGDTEFELLKSLHTMPDELCGKGGLYLRMLQGISREHLQEASRLFRLVSTSYMPVHIFQLFFAAEGHLDCKGELRAQLEGYNHSKLRIKALERMQKRLRSRCAGLLESIVSGHVQYSTHPLDPPFRTTPLDGAGDARKGIQPLKECLLTPYSTVHQTAKEFMAQNDIWRSIFESVNEDDLNPSLALLSGCIRLLKFDPAQFRQYVPWREYQDDDKNETEFILDVSHIYLADANNQDKRNYVSLVDELDKTCSAAYNPGSIVEQDFQNAHPDIKKRISFASREQPTQWYLLSDPNWEKWPPRLDSFLAYAAFRGLVTYLDEKLREQDISRRRITSDSILSTLMITWGNDVGWMTLEIPQPNVLEILLLHGASPSTVTYRQRFSHESTGVVGTVPSTIWADILESGFVYLRDKGLRGYRFKGKADDWRQGIGQKLHISRRMTSNHINSRDLLLATWIQVAILLIEHGADAEMEIEETRPNQDNTHQTTNTITVIQLIEMCALSSPEISSIIQGIPDMLNRAGAGRQALNSMQEFVNGSLSRTDNPILKSMQGIQHFKMIQYSPHTYYASRIMGRNRMVEFAADRNIYDKDLLPISEDYPMDLINRVVESDEVWLRISIGS